MRRGRVAVMAQMAAGRLCVDRGDLRGAVRRFDRAVALDPVCAQAYLYRAGLKLVLGGLDAAIGDFRALARLDHSFLPAYRDLTTLSAEEFPELIAAADEATRRAPDAAWAWVFRAFTQRSMMRYEAAILDLDRAVSLEPRSAALWAIRSRVKLTNRQALYDGVHDMEKAVALEPSWGWLHCWLGEALRHRRRYRRALACLNKGIELEPAYLRGWAWRGGVKVALGDAAGARVDLDRSLGWDPIYSYDFEYTFDQKAWAYNQRQLADRLLGDVRQALRDLNRAHRFGPRNAWSFNPRRDPAVDARALAELDAYLRRAPRDAWGWAWRGWTLVSAGRFEEALASLDRAARLSPRAAWPRAWRGKALLGLGRYDDALAEVTAALARDPRYAPAWGWRAQARRRLGDARGAVADYSRAVREDHRAAWALAGRGEAKGVLGDLKGALADLDRALGIHPDYPEARGWRAEVLRRARRPHLALADADKALEMKPGLVMVYVTRAMVKRSLKDFRGQIRDMKRALALDPGLFRAEAR